MSSFVLVPGMGCGSWLWQPVVTELLEGGHEVVTLTLPGLGPNDSQLNPSLDDAVRHIVSVIEGGASGPVTLVAHSGSGMAATGAALELGIERVSEIIYYAAVVPVAGRSMTEEFGGPWTENPPLRSPLSLSDVSDTLMPDADESVQRLVYRIMTSTPGRYLYDRPRFSAASLAAPARYLLGAADAPFAEASVVFAQRVEAVIESVPGSHLGMLTHPREIVESLLRK